MIAWLVFHLDSVTMRRAGWQCRFVIKINTSSAKKMIFFCYVRVPGYPTDLYVGYPVPIFWTRANTNQRWVNLTWAVSHMCDWGVHQNTPLEWPTLCNDAPCPGIGGRTFNWYVHYEKYACHHFWRRAEPTKVMSVINKGVIPPWPLEISPGGPNKNK